MSALQLLVTAMVCFIPLGAGLVVIAPPMLSSMLSRREEQARRF